MYKMLLNKHTINSFVREEFFDIFWSYFELKGSCFLTTLPHVYTVLSTFCWY